MIVFEIHSQIEEKCLTSGNGFTKQENTKQEFHQEYYCFLVGIDFDQ